MATQAVKSGQYHAGVLFHKLLVKQSLKEEHEGDIRHRYFNELPITHHKAKELLIEAMKMHDNVLLKRGRIGKHFQCNAIPYNKKLRKNEPNIETNSTATILDRDKLYRLIPDERKRRLLLGRKRWTKQEELNLNEESEYITAEKIQADKLCNGVQIRVITISLISWIGSPSSTMSENSLDPYFFLMFLLEP